MNWAFVIGVLVPYVLLVVALVLLWMKFSRGWLGPQPKEVWKSSRGFQKLHVDGEETVQERQQDLELCQVVS